jgi:signal transduction histidine kinase
MGIPHQVNRYAAGAWSLLVPAATAASVIGVLWFMNQAVSNERLAARQKLQEAYGAQLETAAARVRESWVQFEVPPQLDTAPATVAFAEVIRSGRADGAVIRGESGAVEYPDEAIVPVVPEPDSDVWDDAQRMEFAARDYTGAAGLYGLVGRLTPDPQLSARAYFAAARSLAKAGQKTAASDLLTTAFAQAGLADVRDNSGNLLALNAELAAIQLTDAPESSASALIRRVSDYSTLDLPAAQRRFMFGELLELTRDANAQQLAAAEDLSSAFVDSGAARQDVTGLSATPLPDVWRLSSSDRRVTALLTGKRVLAQAAPHTSQIALPEGARLHFAPLGSRPTTGSVVASADAGPWRLSVVYDTADPTSGAAARRVSVFLWTGTLAAIAIAGSGVIVTRRIRREVRLAGMKNELAATVSHELKTPLAGMRAITETLLSGSLEDRKQTREYLEMLDGETWRLSRLIENFLRFSRIEQRKQNYGSDRVCVNDLATDGMKAAHERLARSGFDVQADLRADGACVAGDFDALLTCVLNLLDNAAKYSGESRRIVLRTASADGKATLTVQDFGIGIPASQLGRIFDSFYQIDQRLSRSAGGSGLGLNIVKSIVSAHGGAVRVDSTPGEGSTFTIELPLRTGKTAG